MKAPWLRTTTTPLMALYFTQNILSESVPEQAFTHSSPSEAVANELSACSCLAMYLWHTINAKAVVDNPDHFYYFFNYSFICLHCLCNVSSILYQYLWWHVIWFLTLYTVYVVMWSLDAVLIFPMLSRLQVSSHKGRNLMFGRMHMNTRQKQSRTRVVLVWVQKYLLEIPLVHHVSLAKMLSVVTLLLRRLFSFFSSLNFLIFFAPCV